MPDISSTAACGSIFFKEDELDPRQPEIAACPQISLVENSSYGYRKLKNKMSRSKRRNKTFSGILVNVM